MERYKKSLKQKAGKRILLVLTIMGISSFRLFAQDDALSLDDIPVNNKQVKEAFNGSYIINNQSTNTPQEGRLDFLILHRFGEFSDGAFNGFGLDYAAIRLGFDYGITNNLAVGIGRSSVGKNYDTHLKYRILTQTVGGGKNIPVNLVLFTSTALSSTELRRQNEVHETNQFMNQLVYTYEAMISREMSHKLSFQTTASVIHRNTVAYEDYDHNIVALSFGGRLKLSKRMYLLGDYSYVFNNKEDGLYNPVALGLDIVTGGHVFQAYLTNTVGFIQKEFLTATRGNIAEGDIRIGFSVRRAFMLKREVKGGYIK